MHPPIVKGNPYPIYFHVLCGESSKRHWGKYDDINPLSQSLFQTLRSNWSSHVLPSGRGQGTFQPVCLRAFGSSCLQQCRGREGRVYYLWRKCCFASFLLAGPHREHMLPLFLDLPTRAISTPFPKSFLEDLANAWTDAAGTASPCECELCHESYCGEGRV